MKLLFITIIKRVIVVVSSLIFFASITEIVLNVLPEEYQRLSKVYFTIADEQASKCMELDEITIYRFIKNPPQTTGCPPTDQYGFRLTRDQKFIGGKKTVFLGDSFTYGHGVNSNETYPWYIYRLFQESKINVNIYNAGVPGYGMDQEILQLETDILSKIKPDIIVWNIHENDFYDNNQACLFTIENDLLVKHSAKFNTIYALSKIHARVPEFIKSTKLYWFLLSSFPRRWTYGCSIAENSNNYKEYQLEKMTILLAYMKKLSETHNFKLIVTFVQGQYGYETEDRQPSWYKNRTKKILDVIKYTIANSVIITELVKSQNQIALNRKNTVLDVSTDLSQNLFLQLDGSFEFGSKHMNPAGNFELAKAVFPALKDLISPVAMSSGP